MSGSLPPQQASNSGQNLWMSQATPPQGFESSGNSQVVRGPLQNMTQQAPQGQNSMQPSPSHLHAQSNHLMSVGPPPRSGPTPHQHPTPGPGSNSAGPFPNQVSPNIVPQLPFAPGSVAPTSSVGPQQGLNPPMQLPPPLERAKFDNAYKSYVTTANIKHDVRLMNVEGRPIDLYALHAFVMREGGYTKVFFLLFHPPR